jgi:predicted ABC-type ATPase
MLEQMANYVRQDESFAFETTLAALNYARSIPEWRAKGYVVKLHFLSLPSAEVAIARVAERVRQGGHNVPVEVIRRRFSSGIKNFDSVYKTIVDEWILYDCAGEEPKVIDYGENP